MREWDQGEREIPGSSRRILGSQGWTSCRWDWGRCRRSVFVFSFWVFGRRWWAVLRVFWVSSDFGKLVVGLPLILGLLLRRFESLIRSLLVWFRLVWWVFSSGLWEHLSWGWLRVVFCLYFWLCLVSGSIFVHVIWFVHQFLFLYGLQFFSSLFRRVLVHQGIFDVLYLSIFHNWFLFHLGLFIHFHHLIVIRRVIDHHLIHHHQIHLIIIILFDENKIN